MYSVSGASGAPAKDGEASKGAALKPLAPAPAALSSSTPYGSLRIDSLFTSERLAPIGVLVVALFTRFYRLAEPSGVVFDESHFGRFTNQYTARTYFFDIHPPLGKLAFWLMGILVGYNHPPGQNPAHRPYLGLETDCHYEHISEEYHPECKYAWLRAVSATHSAFTILVMYYIGRRWSGSPWGGILTAGLLTFDMLNHIEGRLVLMDVQLIFWCTLSLWVAIKWWDRLDEDGDAVDVAAAVAAAEAAAGVAQRAEEAARLAATTADAAQLALDNFVPPSTSTSSGGGGAGEAGSSGSASSAVSPGKPLTQQALLVAVSRATVAAAQAAEAAEAAAAAAGAAGAAAASLGSALNEHTGAAPRLLTNTARLLWAVGLGLCCGNAFSVKMTGLATPALIGMESALGLWFLKRPAQWRDLFTVLFTGLAVYTAYFAMHFYLLTRHGDGDDEFMNEAFRRTILENKIYDPAAVWEGFWKTLIDLNIRMVVHNANILEPHPWQSKWWEWVFNLRGVSYYGKDLPYTYTAHMYLIGNHAIHWSVIVGIVGLLGLGLFYLRYRNMPRFSPWLQHRYKAYFAQATFCLAVYALNMAPYMAVARSTFCYHYMPALVYGELIVARTLDLLAGPRFSALATKLALLGVGLVWFHYTPWIYGFPLTNDGHQRRRWIERWN